MKKQKSIEIKNLVEKILYRAWLCMEEEQFEIVENLIIEILDDPESSLLKDKHFELLSRFANNAEREQLKSLVEDLAVVKL